MTNKLALIVAVVLGVCSILGIRFYVEKVKTSYEQTAQLVDVPVAMARTAYRPTWLNVTSKPA